MKSLSLRASLVLAFTALLSACGAGTTETAAPIQMASVVHTAALSGTSGAAMSAATPPASGPGNPAPDCAAEGCKSLRIIDGNAEAWRIDAQRRAALEAAVRNTAL